MKKENSVYRTAAFLMVMTVIAKLVGFIREAVIGYFFGASLETDIYYTASGFVTGVIFAMTASISVAFIPTYTRAKKEGKYDFLLRCVFLFIVMGLVATGIFEITAPRLAVFLAPSYTVNELKTLENFIRMFSVGIIFSLLANLFLSTLNAEAIFGYAAISGLLYSGISIIFVFLFGKSLGVKALIFSVVVGYFVQCLVLFIRCRGYIKVSHPLFCFDIYMKNLLITSVPVLVSNTIAEINHMVDRILATGLTEGAVSALSYANTLFNLVFQIICNTFITIGFTEFTNYAVQSNKEAITKSVRQYFAIICLLVVPVTIITSRCGTDIVKITFMRGKFDLEAASMTGIVLSIYAFSFVLAGLYMLLNKVFYALNDYRTPTIFGIISVALNIVLSIVGCGFIGLQGIVWATVIANSSLTVFLVIGLHRKKIKIFDREFYKEIFSYLLSGTLAYLLLKVFHHYIVLDYAVASFVSSCFIGFGVYLLTLLFMKNTRLKEIKVFVLQKGVKRKGKIWS